MRNVTQLVQSYLHWGLRGGKLLAIKIHKTKHRLVKIRSKLLAVWWEDSKIALSLTLTRMQINHTGVEVCFCGADRPHQRWQLLENVRYGQGLTVQRPPRTTTTYATGLTRPHWSKVSSCWIAWWISTFVTCMLENGDVNFCRWFCNTDDFVYPVDLRKGCFQVSNFVCTKLALSWHTSRSFQCAFTCLSIKIRERYGAILTMWLYCPAMLCKWGRNWGAWLAGARMQPEG